METELRVCSLIKYHHRQSKSVILFGVVSMQRWYYQSLLFHTKLFEKVVYFPVFSFPFFLLFPYLSSVPYYHSHKPIQGSQIKKFLELHISPHPLSTWCWLLWCSLPWFMNKGATAPWFLGHITIQVTLQLLARLCYTCSFSVSSSSFPSLFPSMEFFPGSCLPFEISPILKA